MPFSKDTFRYFDLAKKNPNKKVWFDKNETLYLDGVKKPMGEIAVKIWEKFADDLPKIEISPKKVTRPLRNKNKVTPDSPLVKQDSSFFLAEKATSRFEWNPGIYFQISGNKDGNLMGLGIYMTSSRQMKKMRRSIVDNFEHFDKIMKNPKLKKRWGALSGDLYTRFPKEYDETRPYAKYLKHKQFFLSKHYTRTQMMQKNFMQEVVKDLEAAMPFFIWIRDKVGTYQDRAKFTYRDDG